MDTKERFAAHDVVLPAGYLPRPQAHLVSPRDRKHFEWTMEHLGAINAKTVLDVGCYDGWLDFLLIGSRGYKVTGVELVPSLADAARRYADRNFIHYKVHDGFFLDVDIKEKFDAVLCYEVLEHVALEEVPAYVQKIENLCTTEVLISLPDQSHTNNPQHLWSPTQDLIDSTWGNRKDFQCTRFPYPSTPEVPDNFLISYSV